MVGGLYTKLTMHNINSGYGLLTAASLFAARPTYGKVFFVGDSGTVDLDRVRQLFRVDPNSKVRYFDDLEECLNSGAVVADRNDVILLAPGHTETIVAAAGISLDIAGVTVLGLGTGSLRPTFNFTTSTAADINIDAANVTIENCIFNLTGVDALVAPIDVNATDFTLRNCLVVTASASAQATLGILTDANASRMTLEGNEFLGTTDAGTAAAVRIVGGNEHRILNNRFYGAYTTSLGAIDNVTTAALRCTVAGNVIENATASSTKAMVWVSTSTGSIYNNRMQILSGTAPITGAAMSWSGGNYYAGAIATAGTLI